LEWKNYLWIDTAEGLVFGMETGAKEDYLREDQT